MQNISPLTLGAILSSEACNTAAFEVGNQICASAIVFTRTRGTVVDIFKQKGEVVRMERKHAQALNVSPTPLKFDGV